MADIELVIKIPEEDYLTFSKLSEKEKINELSYYERIIANATIVGTDKDNKIVRVGDEIYSELTDCKAVVQRIDAWHRYECFTDNGSQFIIGEETFNDYWVKTGKNYPQITEILKQMKEGK